MKITLLVLFTTILFGTGCSTVESSKRIQASVTARDWNSVSSSYETRPTHAKLYRIKGGKKLLELTMDSYGPADTMVVFHEDFVPQYLQAIQKFEEWKSLATQRGDQITREIAKIKSYGEAQVLFEFHSGNKQVHYLSVASYASSLFGSVSATGDALFFEGKEVDDLKNMLMELSKTSVEDLSDIYK